MVSGQPKLISLKVSLLCLGDTVSLLCLGDKVSLLCLGDKVSLLCLGDKVLLCTVFVFNISIMFIITVLCSSLQYLR